MQIGVKNNCIFKIIPNTYISLEEYNLTIS